jgi:predicted AlkP superfamily pyrophosphatase or phosphodiesterase
MRILRLAPALVAATLIVAMATFTRPAGAQRGPAGSGPRLAVLIMVDQMRADYVDRFKDDWSAGLKRLVTNGAWFTNAAYPYLTTVTCAGHATVATGAFPRTHGIFQNAWYSRDDRRVTTCTEDSSVNAVEYDGDVDGGGDSSARLRLPTFADEMRRQRNARVVSLALKPRSAIMMAGKAGDAVTWLNVDLDGWETSTAFSRQMVPAVKRFLDASPISRDFGQVWDRLLPIARYTEPDAATGEAPPRGWTPLFSHPLRGTGNEPDASFHTQWERSPFADAFVGRLAATLAESFALGTRETTDVLLVSFSSPDLVGHGFGPRSQEIRDMYAHLDRTVGTLFDALDRQVGKDAYVVALASDHGVSILPEQSKEAGRDGGRVTATALANFIERSAQVAGPGRYVARVYGNDVYFEPGMYDRLHKPAAALTTVIENLSQQPGIARVFRSEELVNAHTSADPLLRAAALSYVPGASGDLIMALKPGWMFIATGTTHGSANPDDQRVPVMFMGPGIVPGVYSDPITPADVSPTLAALVGITMPRAEGQAATAAVRRP